MVNEPSLRPGHPQCPSALGLPLPPPHLLCIPSTESPTHPSHQVLGGWEFRIPQPASPFSGNACGPRDKATSFVVGPSGGRRGNFLRRGSKKWDYCFKGNAVLRPLITPVSPSGSALLCSVQPILLLSLPPLLLVTHGPFCEWPLPTLPAFCPRLPPPTLRGPFPHPPAPTVSLYSFISSLKSWSPRTEELSGADWCLRTCCVAMGLYVTSLCLGLLGLFVRVK